MPVTMAVSNTESPGVPVGDPPPGAAMISVAVLEVPRKVSVKVTQSVSPLRQLRIAVFPVWVVVVLLSREWTVMAVRVHPAGSGSGSVIRVKALWLKVVVSRICTFPPGEPGRVNGGTTYSLLPLRVKLLTKLLGR